MSERSSRGSNRYRYGYCTNPECKQRGRKNVQKISSHDDFVCEECKHDLQECSRPKTFMEKYGKYVYIIVALCVVAAGTIFGMQKCSNPETAPQEPQLVSVDTITVDSMIYEVKTFVLDETFSKDSTLIGKVAAEIKEAVPVLLTTDTVTIDTLVYEIKTYGLNNEILKDSVVIDRVPQPKITGGTTTPKPTISVPFGKYSGPANGLDGEITVTRAYTLDLRNDNREKIELLPGDRITRTKFKDGELVAGYWQRGSEKRAFHR